MTDNIYMCDEVRQVRHLYRDLLTDDQFSLPIAAQLDAIAQRLCRAHHDRDPVVRPQITCWHPDLIGQDLPSILDFDFGIDDARQTVAREHGFDSWDDVEQQGNAPPDRDFELAVDDALTGNLESLRQRLRLDPDLVVQRSAYGHAATLLHYCGSNGVETHRQIVPVNLVSIIELLLDSGANALATANMYGGGCTTRDLLTSSVHPARAGVLPEVAELLQAAENRST